MLGVEEGEDPTSFLNGSIKRLEDELESIIYYGVSKHEMKHPKNPKLGKELLSLYFILSFLAKGISRKCEIGVLAKMVSLNSL